MEVVCFITYKNDSTSIKHFQQLQNDLKNNIDVDVYLLYNNSTEKLHNELYEANNVYEFNKQIVEQNGFEFHYYYWINKGDFYGHNNELIWLNFYKTHKNYNKYWFIDYDILYTGNWNDIIKECKKHEYDLCSCNIMLRYPIDPSFKYHVKDTYKFNHKKFLHAFTPIVAFSNNTMNYLINVYDDGNFGFCETFIPSILYYNYDNFKILNLNDLGFVEDYKVTENDYYSSMSPTDYKIQDIVNFKPNILYHAVKNESDIMFNNKI